MRSRPILCGLLLLATAACVPAQTPPATPDPRSSAGGPPGATAGENGVDPAAALAEPGGEPDPSAADPYAEARARCVVLSNDYRARAGKGPVAVSAEIERYADEGAAFDHHATPHDHFSSTEGNVFAENECPRWPVTADLLQVVDDCLAAFWSEGPGGGHYENLIGDYGTVGCGFYREGSEITIVQDFGQ